MFIKIRGISNPPDYYYQDIRLKGNDSEKWIIQVDVPTDVIEQYPETYPPLLSWDVSELCDIGCFSLWSSDEDGNLLSLLVEDMILEESYQMQKEDMNYIAIVWSKEMTTEMTLTKGWSMISLPIRPGIGDVTTIFPGAVVVYNYQKGTGYVRVPSGENLEAGMGYWILSDNPQSYFIEGTKLTEYTIPVTDGWYMIGGCSLPADKMVTIGKIDVIYSYAQDKGYTRLLESQPLERCKGYWIKFSDTFEGTKFTGSTAALKYVVGH